MNTIRLILLRSSGWVEACLRYIAHFFSWTLLLLVLVVCTEVFTRKLGWRVPHLDSTRLQELAWHLQAVVFCAWLGYAYRGRFRDVRRGLAARWRLQDPVRFTLSWHHEGVARRERLVVRMEPAESLNGTSRRREFQIIDAMQGVVPVPPCFWMDPEGEWFPEPVIVYGFVSGVTAPSRSDARISGTGSAFPADLRDQLGPQFTRHLAAIHRHDVTAHPLDAFDFPKTGTTQSAQWQLNRALRIWEEDRGEEFPLMDVAVNWLNRNLPVLDVPSMNHGDYRAGNFLFHEQSGEVTAILDWERAYVGDRHRDLAWSSSRILGHMDEQGREFLICGLTSEAEFLDLYQEESGLTIDPAKLGFYRILTRYQQVQTVLGTAYRVVRLSKSHQNIVVSRLEAIAYMLAEELRASLEEVL